MKFCSKTILAGILIAILSSCAANKATIGGVGGAGVGAIAGQAIGHSTEATLIGAAVGGGVGYLIGNEMDKYDQQKMTQTFEKGRSNHPVQWRNPDNGNSYTVTPQPAYKDQSARNCRKARIEAVIDGRREVVNSTACRNQFGEWEIQK